MDKDIIEFNVNKAIKELIPVIVEETINQLIEKRISTTNLARKQFRLRINWFDRIREVSGFANKEDLEEARKFILEEMENILVKCDAELEWYKVRILVAKKYKLSMRKIPYEYK